MAETTSPSEQVITQLGVYPLPDVLYHYTTPRGVLGIIQYGRIWATDVRYLSDSQEFQYAIDLAQRELAGIYDRSPIDEKALLDEFKRALSFAGQMRFFVASFSTNGDLLSQWRAYCPPLGGFAVGFTSQVLLDASSGFLLPCIYDPDEQRNRFGQVVEVLLKSFRARPASEAEPERAIRIAGLGAEFFTALLLFAVVFKDPGFKEEQEWRLVRRGVDNVKVYFREGRSGIVPYTYAPVKKEDLPIRLDCIVVGPNPHPALAKESMLALLSSVVAKHDGVLESKIPYRTW